MTPNKPEVEEAAQELVSIKNSALENQMLRLVSRLAKTINYNAEAMNKLVRRVDELEKLVTHESVEETQEEGEYLEMLLKRGAYKVRCVKTESNAYIVNKVYVVEQRVEARHKFVRNENGVECGSSESLFVEVPIDLEPFIAVTRMFMGLPTTQLIHPRSL